MNNTKQSLWHIVVFICSITVLVLTGSGSEPLLAEPAQRTVHIGEPRPVAPPSSLGGNFLVKLADGSLLTNVRIPRRKHAWHWSADLGRTWREGQKYKPAAPPQYPTILRDGTILAYGMRPRKLPGKGVCQYDMWRGKDSYESIKQMKCRVTVPDAAPGTGDRLDWENQAQGMYFHSPNIVEMPDGRLLATMYGWLAGDLEPVTDQRLVGDARKKGVPVHNRYCSIIIQSKDRGQNWHYLSTISRTVKPVDRQGRPIGIEGPCEPTMVRTRDGDLVTIMRVGRQTPLFQARSRDGGRTWSKARHLEAYGVAPNMIVMQDGTLACAYGVKADNALLKARWYLGPRIMFSFDGGHTWPIDKLVKGPNPGNYPGVREIQPGVLLYSYAFGKGPDGGSPQWRSRQVMVVRITLNGM